MRPEDAIRIRHMVEAAESAQRFITGRKRADIDTDEQLRFALLRAVEIIGEAASRICPETRSPFRRCLGLISFLCAIV